MDRRSSMPGRGPNSTSSSSSSSNRGVLRQFRPAISDQWLANDPKTLSRRTTISSSGGGILRESRKNHSSRPSSGGVPLPLTPSATHSTSASSSRLSSSRLTCPECLVTVDGIQGLENHFQRRHADTAGGGSSTLLTCPHCSEAIKHRTNLHRHIRVKHDERTGRHHCRKCSFSCGTEAELELHKQKHRACPFCQVVMESGTGLAKHMQNCRHRIPTRR